ncbi:AAA family ATPase [Actinomadura fulvescens]|uniref:AAA family ATPase n=1 Tax=Actinomadura fulvescens TaxID=46160 RepID=A0ABN3PM48_9ACTN
MSVISGTVAHSLAGTTGAGRSFSEHRRPRGPRPGETIRELNERATSAQLTELRYPAGSLVLVAGLPGAGKSTLLDRLYGLRGDETLPVISGDARVIDSRQSRNWWARFLGPVPQRLRVPVVHASHVWRIARAMFRGHAVVAHTRGTWPHILRGFAWLARRRDAEVHLILLDVDARTARAGQVARGRIVTPAAFARHVRRWRPLMERARDGHVPPADGVTVLDRAAADRLKTIRFDAAPGGEPESR